MFKEYFNFIFQFELPLHINLLADTLRIFCRQAALDAHKLYYVPQFEKSEQRLTSSEFEFLGFNRGPNN